MFGKRKRLNRSSSKKYFSRAADHIHGKNFMSHGGVSGGPMRGGIRL